jgi:glycosyltransferase involved in cell wall biosynthesis
MIEGSPGSWFKHVHSAIHAAAAMREPHHVTVVCGDRKTLGEVTADEIVGPLSHPQMAELYERTDVLLKLSSVEGMFGPPLEGFHKGATCVVTPVTGYEEYVEHGVNGLLTDWEDLRGTARQLDLLARDRELLHFLRSNALVTIAREPAPTASVPSARLLADLRGGLEIYESQLRERTDFAHRADRFERRVKRLRGSRAGRLLIAIRRHRFTRIALRPLRPLYRRLRRKL